MEDTVETVASDDEGSSEGEGSSEVATLLELQSSGRALRHEGRRSLQGGRGAAAAMEVTSGDSLAIAMQALVDAVEAVKKDSEVEQLQEALETAKAAAATSFNMCTSYL